MARERSKVTERTDAIGARAPSLAEEGGKERASEQGRAEPERGGSLHLEGEAAGPARPDLARLCSADAFPQPRDGGRAELSPTTRMWRGEEETNGRYGKPTEPGECSGAFHLRCWSGGERGPGRPALPLGL